MAKLHPSAVVDPKADLDSTVEIGPFCFVGAGVKIGPETRLDSHVTIKSGTSLGARNFIAQGAILGGDPQDRKHTGEPTFLVVGDDNVIREYVTIHRATGGGNSTTVGDRCFLMAFVHLGHNVSLHNDVTIANGVGVSGHVTIEDTVTIGGMTGIHQWVRVGRLSMVGGMSRIVKDVPPFMLVEGMHQKVRDINAVGIRRAGVSLEGRMALHKACRLLYRSQLALPHAIETIRRDVPSTPEIEELIAFVERILSGKNGRGDQP